MDLENCSHSEDLSLFHRPPTYLERGSTRGHNYHRTAFKASEILVESSIGLLSTKIFQFFMIAHIH